MKRLALRGCAAVLLAGGFGWVGGANADVLDLGTHSPLTITDIAGLTSLSFSASPGPATDIKEANNNVTTVGNPTFDSLFPNQNETTVQSGIQSMFGVTGLSFISVGSGGNAGPGTFTPGSSFNWAAVHQDSGEIVFEFATAQTSITFAAGTPQLSDINFYSGGVPSAVPEPSTWAMMLLGFVGLGFAFRQSRRKVSFA